METYMPEKKPTRILEFGFTEGYDFDDGFVSRGNQAADKQREINENTEKEVKKSGISDITPEERAFVESQRSRADQLLALYVMGDVGERKE